MGGGGKEKKKLIVKKCQLDFGCLLNYQDM